MKTFSLITLACLISTHAFAWSHGELGEAFSQATLPTSFDQSTRAGICAEENNKLVATFLVTANIPQQSDAEVELLLISAFQNNDGSLRNGEGVDIEDPSFIDMEQIMGLLMSGGSQWKVDTILGSKTSNGGKYQLRQKDNRYYAKVNRGNTSSYCVFGKKSLSIE